MIRFHLRSHHAANLNVLGSRVNYVLFYKLSIVLRRLSKREGLYRIGNKTLEDFDWVKAGDRCLQG
jgi:hypothetical protein